MDRDAVEQRFQWALDHERQAILREGRHELLMQAEALMDKAGCHVPLSREQQDWILDNKLEAQRERRRAETNLNAAIDIEERLRHEDAT